MGGHLGWGINVGNGYSEDKKWIQQLLEDNTASHNEIKAEIKIIKDVYIKDVTKNTTTIRIMGKVIYVLSAALLALIGKVIGDWIIKYGG